jgi:hypothetical protein
MAIEKLQGQAITKNQTPISFYLFPVDRVPEFNLNEFEMSNDLPQGLVYIEDFIDSNYANKILDYVDKTNCENTLKKRKVKHYGYEFRYGTNDCDESKQLNGNASVEWKDSVVHTYGKEFEKSDLFVAWRLNPKTAKNKTEEEIDQSSESNNLFLRYYHVFQQNELEALFEYKPGVKIVESFYEQGNWCVIFQKEPVRY